MAYKLDLDGTRGDQFIRAIPLQHPTTPPTPLTVAEAQSLITAYPTIEMQVRAVATDATPLISLTAAAGELVIQAAYLLPDGTTGPVLVITADPVKCGAVLVGKYDIQFSGVGVGPYTWVGGTFKLTQDVTRATG